MTTLRTDRWRRLAAAFALLGVLAYATLLPWHVTSRYALRSAENAVLSGLSVICHPGIATAASDAASAPAQGQAPVENQTSCPICKGLSAFSLAILPVAVPEIPPREIASLPASRPDSVSAPSPAITANSRGPPRA